mgnify:FL=1|jgi:hypothetical protein
MYKKHDQLQIDDFIFPYGELDQNNEWITLAGLIPWEAIEKKYASNFVNNGHPAHPCRMALGALIIKQTLDCSDAWTVRHISENPYLQYFIGLKAYQSTCPFGESTMVAFRKRFSEEDLTAINEMIIAEKGKSDDDSHDEPKGTPPSQADGPEEGEGYSHEGTLILDATCAPADIRYPQDLSLLNEARKNLEAIMDSLHEQTTGKIKPRNYRKQALKAYQRISKKRRKGSKEIRKGIRRQLGYLRRDIAIIADYLEEGTNLGPRQQQRLETILELYAQQQAMYDAKSHTIPDRIVSLSQHWVRPIVRGKVTAKTEFGSKLHLSVTDGYSRIERLDFDAYNEADELKNAVESYCKRIGHYPERILADKIYRNRENLRYCKEKQIAITGPRLGRPPKNDQEDKKQAYSDLCERNTIEGRFGTAKQSYGMGRIKARLKETSVTVIYLSVIVLNLRKRLAAFLWRFFGWPIQMPLLTSFIFE